MFQFQSDSPLCKGHIYKEQSNEITIFDKSTWKRLQVWISGFHHSFWNVRNSRIGYFTCHQYLFYIVILKLLLWHSHFHIATMEHEVLRNYWMTPKVSQVRLMHVCTSCSVQWKHEFLGSVSLERLILWTWVGGGVGDNFC